MLHKWSVLSPSGNSSIHSFLDNQLDSTDTVTFPSGLLKAGVSYRFELAVSNFLAKTSFYSIAHSVEVDPLPVPEVTLTAPINFLTGTVAVSESFYITPDVKVQHA